MFNLEKARLLASGYRGSPHKVFEDIDGRRMLFCESRRTPGVAVNWPALQHFRESGGEFIGLKNPDFKIVVPLSKIASITPYGSDEFIIVRPGDVDVEVEVKTNFEPLLF